MMRCRLDGGVNQDVNVKGETMKRGLCVVMGLLMAANGWSAGLLGRVKAQADKVAVAYGETWNSFYGDGHYKNLMTASLDVRPDGTPNIVLDEAAGKMTATIRLAVNEANYEAWKTAAHARFAAADMSFRFSDFEDPEGRMIGGRNYRFGDNEEASIKRWEAKDGNGYKAKLSIRVQLVDKAGKVFRDDFLPLEKFQRLGYASYPIPLHSLNRLLDLPRGRFKWFESETEPTADAHVEDGYARIAYSGLTQAEMDTLEDVRCTILDEVDVRAIHEEVAERERQVRAAVRAARIASTKTVMLPGGSRMKFVWCPPGSFMMGSPTSEKGRCDDETLHRVTLTKGFWMAQTEVTQAQWESVMGNNPSYFKGADRPVENVSWEDCQAFLRKAGQGLRLPTEAEWEYACRADSAESFAGDLDGMVWYGGNSKGETHAVGTKTPNAWGLYDMHGNVWEWCEDWYGRYPEGTLTDPTGPASGGRRVNRGGGWSLGSRSCRSADRCGNGPGGRIFNLGFRVAYSAGLHD